MKTVIIDLETIPDKSVWTDAPIEDDDESEEPPKPRRGRPKKKPFPPPYAHQIICAGFSIFDDNNCLGVGHMEAATKEQEKELLSSLPEYLNDADKIVSWNGKHFDVPVIQLRSLHHGIPQPWIDGDVRKRYGEKHTDLCEIFTEYGGLGKTGFNLDTFAKMIGFPGKNGFDGSLVHAAFVAGKIDLITQYCRRDVVQTAGLWLRWALLRGTLDADKYNEGVKSLLEAARGVEGMTATEFEVNVSLLRV